MKILAIETSCDETAAAVIEVKRQSNQLSVISTDNLITDNCTLSTSILSNVISSQIKIHQKFGGVFPEMASRAHAEKIIPVVEEVLESVKDISAIDLIAVTTGPGLIGSLLIGVNFAKTLAYATGKPIIGINHWLGHIYSNWAKKPHPQFPALILIASGGHTGLVLMKSHNDIQTLGETLDDAAGEAFDKVAKLLNLGYPGGPSIAAAATKSRSPKSESRSLEFNFPRSMLDRKDYNFSFSGLKTAVLYKVKELTQKYSLDVIRPVIASEFQQTVVDILIGKTIQAAYEFKPKSICLCGGVSANKSLREQMKVAVEKLPWKTSFHVPDFILSTDNAAMIGIAAAYHLDKQTTWDKINVNSNLKL